MSQYAWFYHRGLLCHFLPKGKKWKTSKDPATWNNFTDNAIYSYSYNRNTSLEDSAILLAKNLNDAAGKCFPFTSGRYGGRPQHVWWTGECKAAIRTRNSAFNRWRSHPSVMNCINYRHERAQCRRLLLKTKKEAWRKVTSKLNFSTSSRDAWSLIK